ncbi:MAG: hypothetical protein ACRD0F_03505 [Acidimicrobiales bacterium]
MLLPPDRRRSLVEVRLAGAYLAGTCSGALATGLVAWVASGLLEGVPAGPRMVLIVVSAAVVWLSLEGPLRGVVRLPESRRQIPAEVFGGGLVRGAYRFGFELGTGVRTYVPSPAPYLVLAAVVLGRLTLAQAVLVSAGFGIGRALPVAVPALVARHRLRGLEVLREGVRVGPAVPSLLVVGGALALA